MKIIIIGSFPVDTEKIKGGVESSVYGLANALAEKNEVLVVDLPRQNIEDGYEQHGNIVVHRFSNPGCRNLDGTRRANDIAQWVASQSPDICHLHGTSITAFKIFQALKHQGLATILTVHGLAHVEKKKALGTRPSIKTLFQYLYQRHYELKLINACPCIIVDTPYVAESIRASSPRMRQTVCHTIPQGIDTSYLDTQCDIAAPKLLAVGSYSQRKGHLQLLEAFSLLVERRPDVQLTIAGSSSDTEYLHKVKSYIESKQWGNRVNLLTNVDTDTLHRLYSEAHLFVLHSFEESQGIVFLEAMAAGLPIVATRVGGIPDVVSDYENGLLCETNNAEKFAEAISLLLDDTNLWGKLSSLNKGKAEQYTWPIIAERVEELYKTLIHS